MSATLLKTRSGFEKNARCDCTCCGDNVGSARDINIPAPERRTGLTASKFDRKDTLAAIIAVYELLAPLLLGLLLVGVVGGAIFYFLFR